MAKLNRDVIAVKQRTFGVKNGTTRDTSGAREQHLAESVARYLEAVTSPAEVRALIVLFRPVVLH